MKKLKTYKNFEDYDFSKLGCTELTGDILFKINDGEKKIKA